MFLEETRKLLKNGASPSDISAFLKAAQEDMGAMDREFTQSLMLIFEKASEIEPAAKRRRLMEGVLEALDAYSIPWKLVNAAAEQKLRVPQYTTFKMCTHLQNRRRRLAKHRPEWTLNGKMDAYRFADILKLRRPWTSEERYTVETIFLKPGSVIKPVKGEGSRGVYLVFAENRILSVRSNEMMTSRDAVIQDMKALLAAGRVIRDEWFLEELIAEDREAGVSSRDLKFYCFYGKVGLILEARRSGSWAYCEWMPDGTRANTGRYRQKAFDGEGFTKQQLRLAQRVSARIPAPFIRVDFLATTKEFVFGEFTPRPGNTHMFSAEFDRYLGDCFLKAEGRLYKDLLEGKVFRAFRRFVKNGAKRKSPAKGSGRKGGKAKEKNTKE